MAKCNIWKKITETISKRKTWLDGQSNAVKVLCAGAMSVIIFVLAYLVAIKNSNSNSVGYWNFIILIVSAPVAFVIWHFRDENNRQQIENQRKDINLKEFQKLSEWVSGAHLPEIKTVSKTTNKCNLKNNAEIVRQSTLPIEYTTEETEEYSKQPKTADFDTFSKREGAVALQISAIYNLLPFFRGDYGESFRLPAFDLLKSIWQIMQQDSLKMLEGKSVLDKKQSEVIIRKLEQRAESPLGIALTHVLLSFHKDNNQIILRDFYKILPSICLAGMNFNLGIDGDVAINLSDLDLRMADFRGAVLKKVDFQKSKLYGAKFQSAKLTKANLQEANLFFAKF
uniref:pentapeptide repeat-containing protein n=1 Tax=Neisseria sicca TaxID=490 RepID=UPI0028E1B8F6